MTLSPTMIAAQRSQHTDEMFLDLLTLEHPSFSVPIRLVRDNVPITHDGDVYEPFAFDIIPPDLSSEGGTPIMRLAMQNVSQEIIREVRSISGDEAVAITLRSVLRSEPDHIQQEFPQMEMRRVSFDAETISAEIVMFPFLEQSISKRRFTPATYPGKF